MIYSNPFVDTHFLELASIGILRGPEDTHLSISEKTHILLNHFNEHLK